MHELGHRVLLLHRWDTGKASGTWSEGRLLASIQAVNSFGHNVAVAFTFLHAVDAFRVASRLPDEHDWSRLHRFNNPYASGSNDRLTRSSREPRLHHLTLHLCLRPPGKARPPDT